MRTAISRKLNGLIKAIFTAITNINHFQDNLLQTSRWSKPERWSGLGRKKTSCITASMNLVLIGGHLPLRLVLFAVYSKERCIGAGDKFGNISVLRLPRGADAAAIDRSGQRALWDSSREDSIPKLEMLCQYHVGEVVTSMTRASLVAGGAESLIYVTITGLEYRAIVLAIAGLDIPVEPVPDLVGPCVFPWQMLSVTDRNAFPDSCDVPTDTAALEIFYIPMHHLLETQHRRRNTTARRK